MEEKAKDQLILSLKQLQPEEEEEEEKEEKIKLSFMAAELFPSLHEVEQITGYNFKNQGLLEQAFTHGSYIDKCSFSSSSYERLEYVGDSVLNLLIATNDYFFYPHFSPGKLTRLRAANVDTEKLARVAVKHKLHLYLRHNKPLLDGQIREFKEAIAEYPLHSFGLIDAPKILADIVESMIGAIFIDTNSSLDITWKVLKRLLEPIIIPATIQTHPVTKCHELCQKHGLKLKVVDLWKESGVIEIFVDDEFVERDIYRPKKLIALNRAANNAYQKLVSNLSSAAAEEEDLYQ